MSNDAPNWRRTPPGIFPICLGLLGLGLGLRNASGFVPGITLIGAALLAFACVFYLYFLASYLRKLIARPSVLFEDATKPPARAGIAAIAMSMMLFAAALLSFGISAPILWWTGVIAQIGAGIVGLRAILQDPPEVRQFSAFQLLSFVGLIVGPIAGVPLGYATTSLILTFVALAAWAVITIGLMLQLRRQLPPPPLRPSLAIFLAPFSLFPISFGLLGIDWAFLWLYWLAIAVAITLILLIPWMTKGGFSPVWAAFTFPIAAFLQLQLMAVAKYDIGLATIGVYAALIVSTPVILIIAYRVTKMCLSGALAEKTGSATA